MHIYLSKESMICATSEYKPFCYSEVQDFYDFEFS